MKEDEIFFKWLNSTDSSGQVLTAGTFDNSYWQTVTDDSPYSEPDRTMYPVTIEVPNDSMLILSFFLPTDKDGITFLKEEEMVIGLDKKQREQFCNNPEIFIMRAFKAFGKLPFTDGSGVTFERNLAIEVLIQKYRTRT